MGAQSRKPDPPSWSAAGPLLLLVKSLSFVFLALESSLICLSPLLSLCAFGSSHTGLLTQTELVSVPGLSFSCQWWSWDNDPQLSIGDAEDNEVLQAWRGGMGTGT